MGLLSTSDKEPDAGVISARITAKYHLEKDSSDGRVNTGRRLLHEAGDVGDE